MFPTQHLNNEVQFREFLNGEGETREKREKERERKRRRKKERKEETKKELDRCLGRNVFVYL